jgi:hypothetical protein
MPAWSNAWAIRFAIGRSTRRRWSAVFLGRVLSEDVDHARQAAGLDWLVVAVPAEAGDMIPSARVEAAVEVGIGEEDERCDEWKRLAAQRRLTSEQRLQSLRLPVREDHRVVEADLACPAGLRAPPRTRVTANDTGPALDLDQEQTLRADDEEIDLADVAVLDELEVRPGAIGLMVGQALLEERERLLLPEKLRRRHLDPAVLHVSSPSRGWRRRRKSPNSGAVYA